jgi:hypothetical protein
VLEEVLADADEIPAGTNGSVADSFMENLVTIQKARPGSAPPIRDVETLEAYQALVPKSEHVAKVVIKAERKRVQLDRSYAVKLAKILGPDQLEPGSISGVLEKVNVHNEARFDIFPMTGPTKIRCNFRRNRTQLLKKVGEALGRKVTVYGRLRYKQWSLHPHSVDVEDLVPHPSDADLPRLRDLYGMAPDATGKMTAEDFIASLRHGSD